MKTCSSRQFDTFKKGNAINAHCKTYRYVYSMNHELNGKNGNVIIYNLE